MWAFLGVSLGVPFLMAKPGMKVCHKMKTSNNNDIN